MADEHSRPGVELLFNRALPLVEISPDLLLRCGVGDTQRLLQTTQYGLQAFGCSGLCLLAPSPPRDPGHLIAVTSP